ncbi:MULTISPECIES: FUSC family protein [Enterobacteriaceae]|uniref:FUSC family protein n=1 Tax=Enterobacteriaceae TaxID=543 RepID=UPI00138947CD|nr:MULTISPECIES: FUSC family protein [Enterobacteriaceae]QNE50951.1 FUSC family protein [Klebsiella michiganensis]
MELKRKIKHAPGYDGHPIAFALRTTLAALLALLLAHQFQIHHPWWAAMTVWLVAQPSTRGLLLERFLARMLGSAVGALAGGVILLEFEGRQLPSLLTLAVWLALCAGAGSLFRHYRSYSCVLAGLTGGVIVMSGLNEGMLDMHLAVDRVLCTVVGIACSALLVLRTVPSGQAEGLKARLDLVLQRSLDRVSAHLRFDATSSSAQPLVDDIAALVRSADNDAAGSLQGRRTALRVHEVTGLLLELVALTPAVNGMPEVTPVQHGDTQGRLAAFVRLAAEQAERGNRQAAGLALVLRELRTVLASPVAVGFASVCRDANLQAVWRAAGRPVLALALTFAVWQVTGWHAGPMMVMTAALFSSLLSSNEQGNQILLHVLAGSLIGALAGTLARLFVLPHLGFDGAVLLYIAPFLLWGAWLMRRPATARMATDVNMAFLLTAQPFGTPAESLLAGASESTAIVLGVLAAVATYWLFLPSTPKVHQRLALLRVATLAERASAAAGSGAGEYIHHALRATMVRLLETGSLAEKTFAAGMDCLAQSRLLLNPPTGNSAFRCGTPGPGMTASETLRTASARLKTYLTPLANQQEFK